MAATRKEYRSDPLKALHETMEGLHKHGLIDKATMRHFNVRCLTNVRDFTPEQIRRLREEANMSQAIFAMALNVTTSLVSKWERGEKRPSGPSLKLLSLAQEKGVQSIL
ncbi:helix-turn-helix domain-containing protein [Chthonobacter albigriseus]|uniref:helix-turn-helix domain-containing protein n=1 Tax=Chthonobacter albigriseus TaxID=1683161 RepID=UPI0015EFA870|nr:DNA-binding transcriptional regulator [Chthonobacter albigriseus]